MNLFNRINMLFAPTIEQIERQFKAFRKDTSLEERAEQVSKWDK